jgi:hypothetical protein
MEIPDSYIITDIRNTKDFKGITISGYKRSDVIKAYENSMINNKLEDAIRWCVELHSTGLNDVIWSSLLSIYLKYIHINNPKYFFYFLKRKKDYDNVANKFHKKHEIFIRNNQEIRNLYSELTAISSLSKKNNLFLPKSLPIINLKINTQDQLRQRIISKNLDSIFDYIFNSTSAEEKLALNEIYTNLKSVYGTFQNCLFWYLWLEKKENTNNNIKNKHNIKELWTFILWKIILHFEKRLQKNDSIFIKKMHNEYIHNFKLSQMSKKKYLIFISLYILKNNIQWNINIFSKEYLIIQTNANINIMYQNIKTNIESKLSDEGKDMINKRYFRLLEQVENYNKNHKNNDRHTKIRKVKDTYLDENINKVVYTEFPDYNELSNKDDENYCDIEIADKSTLISKNMTKRDIENEKSIKQDKKLTAFVNFIAFKNNKEDENCENNEEKHTYEYENNDFDNIKNIDFYKKNK